MLSPPMIDDRPVNIRGLTLDELRAHLVTIGAKPFHATNVFRWVHEQQVKNFDEMTDVPARIRTRLAEEFVIAAEAIERVMTGADGTVKFASRLGDGNLVETVLIPDITRLTACVSTQAGCALGCAFCATASSGLIRNLTAAEMVDQLYAIAGVTGKRPTNLVANALAEELFGASSLVS